MSVDHDSLSKRYGAALRRFLKSGTSAIPRSAVTLGRRAVVNGFDVLGLARIHEHALTAEGSQVHDQEAIKRSEQYFLEAIKPILAARRAAKAAGPELKAQRAMLARRTAELAASNRLLKSGIRRRIGVETALKKSGEHYARLLKDSLQLQSGLRKLTRQLLLEQEDQRGRISRELQDDIAQTLLSINVRLVLLKREAKNNTKELNGEIAKTQRLVASSAQSLRRVGKEFAAK